MSQRLTASSRILVDFRPQLLSHRFALLDQLVEYRCWVVNALEQGGVLASLDVEVILTDNRVTILR